MSNRLTKGDWVCTANNLEQRDYIQNTIRRPNSIGEIIAEHNSHGLCFEVRHDDGAVGWYDNDELTLY